MQGFIAKLEIISYDYKQKIFLAKCPDTILEGAEEIPEVTENSFWNGILDGIHEKKNRMRILKYSLR